MADDSSWACSRCTFIHEGSDDNDKCMVCREPRERQSNGNFSDSAVRAETPIKFDPYINKSVRFSDLAPVPVATATRIEGQSIQSSGESIYSDHPPEENRLDSYLNRSMRLSDLMDNRPENILCERHSIDDTLDANNQSIRLTDLTHLKAGGEEEDGNEDWEGRRGGSISRLHNLSFAAWESDRSDWACKACTFLNEPRYLVCGACGMAEGSVGLEDELIASGLQRMSLHSAQDFLMKSVHEQLDLDREDRLRHERAVELLKEQIRDEYAYDASKFSDKQLTAFDIAKSTADQKASSSLAIARKHIGTLERIQQSEKDEHEEMIFTLHKWRLALHENQDAEQEREMHRQEQQLQGLMKEWEERNNELIQLRKRLDGDMATI